MSNLSEEVIIDKIEKEYDEKYLLIETLRNIFKGKKEEYDIQIITSQLLDLYKNEKEKNEYCYNKAYNLGKAFYGQKIRERIKELEMEKENNSDYATIQAIILDYENILEETNE